MALFGKKVKKSMQDYKLILELYKSAFPKNERIPLYLLKWDSKRKNIDFLAFYDDENFNTFVGFVYLLHHNSLSYLCFFAIAEQVRGKGYGSKILQYLQKEYAKQTIVLAIEEVNPKYDNYEERLKRQDFYQKNNFTLSGMSITERKVNYFLMHYGKEQNQTAYKQLFKRYACGLIPIKIYDKNGNKL